MKHVYLRLSVVLRSKIIIISSISFILGLYSCGRISNSTDGNSALQSNLLSDLPLRFIENVGQTLPEVRYHVEGAGHTILFKTNQIVFKRSLELAATKTSNEITMEFEGSNSGTSIQGLRKQKGVTNYYSGSNPEDWHTLIPSFSGVEYTELYPGINMVYLGDEGSLKNEFHLAPGADPDLIMIAYHGIDKLKVDKTGDLHLITANGILVDAAPVAYQLVNGKQKEIKVSYRIRKKKVGFKLGAYDPELPLVIDPLFSYVTYFGGNGYTLGAGVAVDEDGFLLFAGHSLATDLPTENPAQISNAGMEDAFVVKLDTATGEYIYATYLGGSSGDFVHDFNIDEEGNAYITGHTTSSNFPASEKAYQTEPNGLDEAYLAKFSPDGTLIFSTYLGGSYSDHAYGLTLNARQEVYLTGLTQSMDFPLNEALQTMNGGNLDAFVSRISAGGDSLLFSSYLGGSEADFGRSIALDENENILITGQTSSTDYPLANPAQDTHGGLLDAFVTKLISTGQDMVYSTFLGGVENDVGLDIVVDTSGVAYVCGGTQSADFPVKNFGQAKSLKSAEDIPETGSDAYIAFYDALGFLLLADPRRVDGDDYFNTLLIISTAWDQYVAATGVTPFGISVIYYAIPNYYEEVKPVKGETFFTHPDGVEMTIPNGSYWADGSMIINLNTTETYSVDNNATQDPTPGHGHPDNNVMVYTPQADLEVTVTMPESIQNNSVLVAHIKVKNISTDLEALEVELNIDKPDDIILKLINTEDFFFPDYPHHLGNIPAGESVEISVDFKVGYGFFAPAGTEIKVKAKAKGVNTEWETEENTTKVISVIINIITKRFGAREGNKKSTQLEAVDVYVNDQLAADDVIDGVTQQQTVEIAGIYPKVDIINGTDSDNSNPLATYEIDLMGPGTDEVIAPSDHQFILVDDQDEMIHLLHKRDVQTVSSDLSKVELFIAHGAGEVGDVDIRLVEGNNHESILETMYDDIAPDSVTDYTSLTPGIYSIEVSSADNAMVYDVVDVDLSDLAGKALFGVVIPVVNDDQTISATLVISEAAAPTGVENGLYGNSGLKILGAYPNPFIMFTSLVYSLNQPTEMEVSVYSTSGQKIRILYSGYQVEGEHTIMWDGKNEVGKDVDPGIYLTVLKSDTGILNRKITKIW